jgi:hypothetical protein
MKFWSKLCSKFNSPEEIEYFTKKLYFCISKVPLENPLKFRNCTENLISSEGNLSDQEVELQSGELTLHNDVGDIKKVKTCNEWREAVKNNYYALSTYDIKEESYFKIVSATIEMAKEAQTHGKISRRISYSNIATTYLKRNYSVNAGKLSINSKVFKLTVMTL